MGQDVSMMEVFGGTRHHHMQSGTVLGGLVKTFCKGHFGNLPVTTICNPAPFCDVWQRRFVKGILVIYPSPNMAIRHHFKAVGEGGYLGVFWSFTRLGE